jgi:hypothetical protein
VRVGLFCEDYPTLKDRHISKFESGFVNRSGKPMDEAMRDNELVPEFPSWLGKVKETKSEGLCYFLEPAYGGGFISFRNLDDPAKYASTEFAAIYVDELTKNPREVFDALRFRGRWPGVDLAPFVAASNPGSVGHGWVKKLWLDRDFSGDDKQLVTGPQGEDWSDRFMFVPAKAGENPHLSEDYWETLWSLPKVMREAMLEGNWDIFAGMAFSIWNPDVHVVKSHKLPEKWDRWRATDYGFADPYCCLWFARNPEDTEVHVYREHYAKELTAHAQAINIKGASRGESILLTAADPSMWHRRSSAIGDTVAEDYRRAGVDLMRANNDRLTGINRVRQYLDYKSLPNGRMIKPPRLRIHDSCTNLIRTLPQLPYDEKRVEDVDTHAEDHAYDTLRYGLMADVKRLHTVPSPPVDADLEASIA